MINKTTQRYLHGEGEEFGDCMRASFAALLNEDIDNVPHFCRKTNGDAWIDELREWVDQRGLAFIEIQYSYEWCRENLPNSYHLLSGGSPRFPGVCHMVVGKGGEVFHDPHPDRTGLVENTPDRPWTVGFLVPKHFGGDK